MPHHSSHRRFGFIAALLMTALFSAACSGSDKSPTASSSPKLTLHTQWGDATVLTNGHAFDPDRALAAIERGYDRARVQIGDTADAVSISGLGIVVKPGPFAGAIGEYHSRSDLIEIAQGIENVLAHELQHRFCHQLGNGGSCCSYQDHPGGFDLRCQPI